MTEEVARQIPTLSELLEKTEGGSSVVRVYRADTLEELAALMEMDADTLMAAVANYNALCEVGEDTQYGKDASLLLPIAEGPFYAGKVYSIARGTIGGIVTDEGMELTDANGAAIPGLYAARAISNRVYYNNYYPGGQLGVSVNCGYIAADSALAQIGK